MSPVIGAPVGPAGIAAAGYRADIDGLRAIAVIAVLVFHAFPTALAGGFVGVDVFFVISGYLISAQILAGLDQGRFRFRDFYARRIRRIFPALIVVLVACVVAGAWMMPAGDYKSLGLHVAGGAGFASNLVLLREAGYFDTSAELKPLLHLWSLAIEEQFYIVWPLLVFASCRRGVGLALFALLAIAIVGSFAYGAVEPARNSAAAFFLPWGRAWELLIGAALAAVEARRHQPTRRWPVGVGVALSVAGVVAIGIAAVTFDGSRPYPGWRALVPALGTLAIVLAGSQSPLNARVLASRPLVGIGLISLALYLWHWPLLVFARILWPDGLSVGVRLIVLALSFLLAALSTRWVERPVRARSRNGEAVALGAAIAGVAVIGIAIAQEDGLPGRDAARNAFELSFENAGPDYAYMTRHDLFRAYRDECNFVESRSVTVRDRIPEHCFVPTTARSLFLWGDSFAQHLYIGLSHRLPADVSILQVTTSGCWPRTVDVEPDVFNACNKSNRFALEQIRRVRPQVVVLAQNREHEKNDYAETARVLRASGVGHVVVVGPAPQWNPPLYKVIASRYWIHTPERIRTGLIETIFQTDRVFKAGYASPLATYVSLLDGNCDPEGCIAYFGSDREIGIFTFDNGHLTPLSSDYVAAGFLMPVLGPLLSMPVAPLSTTDTDGMAPRPIAIDVTKSPQR